MATQRVLVDALTTIVETEGLEAASVSRIAREAGLSRSGFYEHFANVDGLARFVLDDLLSEISALDLKARLVPGSDGRDVAEFALGIMLDSILSHRALYKHVLLSGHAGGAAGWALERFAQGTRAVIEIARPELPAEELDFLAAAIGGTILGGVMHRLRTDDQCTAPELARDLVSLMPPWLYPTHGNDPHTERSAAHATAPVDQDSTPESDIATPHEEV